MNETAIHGNSNRSAPSGRDSNETESKQTNILWLILQHPIAAWVILLFIALLCESGWHRWLWLSVGGVGLIWGLIWGLTWGLFGTSRNSHSPNAEQMTVELCEKHAEMEAIIQSFPDLYFWLSEDGIIQQFRANQVSDFASSPEQFTGKSMHAVFPRELGARFAETQAKVIASQAIVGIEFSLPQATETKHYEARFSPLKDNHVLVVVRDITERQQMNEALQIAHDKALESARLKAEFLANMSHEIRTPMNGIIGMTDLLMDTDLSTDQRDYTQIVQGSADALLSLINDILDFSKIEAGKMQLESISFNLRTSVEAAMELLAEQALHKKLEMALLFDPDVPELLRGDPGRLRQVLTNLIGNAIKFTEHGEVIVHVSRESETSHTALLRFTVTDTGIGIAPEVLPELFQAFTQADGSTTRKFGGTGLGLAICKQLTALLGGEISVESTPGKGSSFSFTARLEKQAIECEVIAPLQANLRDLRVLIVDDHMISRRILVTQTASWQMRPVEAASGLQALDWLRSAAAQGNPFDLAVIDLQMPDMDGFDLTRAIKSDPAISSTQVILMSTLNRRGHRGHGDLARQLGIAAYLPKPIRRAQLYDCLVMVMSGADQSTLITQHSLNESKARSTASITETAQHTGAILIAEDNDVNQKVLKSQMEELGYHAEIVSNGREAVEALRQKHFDLVLMDCQMPEMDGYAATAAIRQLEGEFRHTPIIALTAHVMIGDRDKCLAAGMDDYLPKPVRYRDLGRMIAHWYKQSDATAGQQALPIDAITVSPSSDASEAPVDVELLMEVGGGNGPGVQDLVTFYLQRATLVIVELQQCLANSDFQQLERVAHSLKGSSATCGMRAVVPALRELEEIARTENHEQIDQVMRRLVKEFDRIKDFLDD